MARVHNSTNLGITLSGYSFTIDGGDGTGGSITSKGLISLSGTGSSTYGIQDKNGTAAFITDINYAATSGSSGTSGQNGTAGTSVASFFPVVNIAGSQSIDNTFAFEYIRSTGATATTFTIRPQADTTWADNSEMMFEQAGAGQVTITGGTGVTINTPLSNKTRTQYSVIALQRDSSNVWTLMGDLELI
jgi:hypothetical protein